MRAASTAAIDSPRQPGHAARRVLFPGDTLRIGWGMDHPALSRIDRAIDRIEAATAKRREALQDITDRHAALKHRMREAVAALDGVLARAEAE